jgi:glycosyltransferase involved in cell wall biosynthesis
MKIGFMTEHYPPREGGVATSAQRVATAMARLGAAVTVVTFDHSRPIESPPYLLAERDGGVEVLRVGPFFSKQLAGSLDSIPEKMRAVLRRRAFCTIYDALNARGVDLVMAFYLLNAAFIGQYVARALGVPFIASVRGNDIGRNIFNVERFSVVRWVVEGADRIVCVNEHLKNRVLLAFPTAAPRLVVIPNSVRLSTPIPERSAARRRLEAVTGWKPEHFVVVFIGRLREKKGVFELTQALAMQTPHSLVRLLVIGPDLSGFEQRMCGSVWSELKESGRLYVTGQLERNEVLSWAAAGDAVVMPSLDDGLPNGLLEGMALGLCPVATTIFSDTIRDGENGLLVPPGDPHALANVLAHLAANPELARRFGASARASVQTWSDVHEAEAYLRLAREVLAERQRCCRG